MYLGVVEGECYPVSMVGIGAGATRSHTLSVRCDVLRSHSRGKEKVVKEAQWLRGRTKSGTTTNASHSFRCLFMPFVSSNAFIATAPVCV